jgi:hypothetical protein
MGVSNYKQIADTWEEAALMQCFRYHFGICARSVSRKMDLEGRIEYVITFSGNPSMKKFEESGIDSSHFRPHESGGLWQCVIPANQLPLPMRRDAAFFRAVIESGLPVIDARRECIDGHTTAYTLLMPPALIHQFPEGIKTMLALGVSMTTVSDEAIQRNHWVFA